MNDSELTNVQFFIRERLFDLLNEEKRLFKQGYDDYHWRVRSVSDAIKATLRRALEENMGEMGFVQCQLFRLQTWEVIVESESPKQIVLSFRIKAEG